MSNQRYSPEFKDEAIANGHPGLGNRSAAALGLYNNLKLKSRWRRDTAYTDSAARCVTSGPMLISGWRRSGESQRPTRARHFGWPCDGSAANRLGGRPANGTRRAIPWVQVNGFRRDRIRRIGHCPLDDKKWGTMSTDPLRSERLRILPRVSTLELYSIRFRTACLGKRRGKSIS